MECFEDYADHLGYMDGFEDYFYDQCSIYASELVGPNAYEWDSVVDRLREDDVYREACLIKYNMEFRQ